MRQPPNPARNRCLDALQRELRRRHNRNRRRMYARRMDDLGTGAFPVIGQMTWRVAVAARWYRIYRQE